MKHIGSQTLGRGRLEEKKQCRCCVMVLVYGACMSHVGLEVLDRPLGLLVGTSPTRLRPLSPAPPRPPRVRSSLPFRVGLRRARRSARIRRPWGHRRPGDATRCDHDPSVSRSEYSSPLPVLPTPILLTARDSPPPPPLPPLPPTAGGAHSERSGGEGFGRAHGDASLTEAAPPTRPGAPSSPLPSPYPLV